MQIAEFKGISKEIFFKEVGITYGNFKGEAKKKALSSDTLATIITIHNDINPEWLLTGKGEMLRSGGEKEEEREVKTADVDTELMRKTINLMEENIGLLRENIKLKDEVLESVKSQKVELQTKLKECEESRKQAIKN